QWFLSSFRSLDSCCHCFAGSPGLFQQTVHSSVSYVFQLFSAFLPAHSFFEQFVRYPESEHSLPEQSLKWFRILLPLPSLSAGRFPSVPQTWQTGGCCLFAAFESSSGTVLWLH